MKFAKYKKSADCEIKSGQQQTNTRPYESLCCSSTGKLQNVFLIWTKFKVKCGTGGKVWDLLSLGYIVWGP